jgi:imidazolonepropionase-like amidohydrolase
MRPLALITLTLILSLVAHSTFGQFSPQYFALRDVYLIDGMSKTVRSHQTIIVRKDRIEKIGPVNEVVIPDSCFILAYSGRYIIPGLIDAHVHLATDVSHIDNRPRAESDLQDMLLSGITSVRDMAGDNRVLASLSRDAGLDEIPAPDIYYAALMAGPSFFNDPRTHLSSKGGVAGQMPYMRAVTHSTDLKLAVAEAKGTGARAIKLYAQLDSGLARKITLEAHQQNLLVWSHTDLTIANPLEVINAGVNSISHAAQIARWPTGKIPDEWLKPNLSESFWDEAFKALPVEAYIRAMLDHKTILDATLVTYKNDLTDTSLSALQKARAIAHWQIGKRFTQLAFTRGIPVCAGTDTDEKKFVQREIKTFVKDCGFTPMEALICATKNGALALGIEGRSGTVSEGKIANLVVLSANPALDIDNLDKVELVIKNGRLFNSH